MPFEYTALEQRVIYKSNKPEVAYESGAGSIVGNKPGKAKLTAKINGLRASSILKNSRYRGLYLMQLNKTDDRCFGVKIGNEGLLKLLNHGLSIMGSEFAQDIAYQYAAELYTYTFSDMVRDNMGLLLFMLLVIALIAIIFIKRDLHRTRRSATIPP